EPMATQWVAACAGAATKRTRAATAAERRTAARDMPPTIPERNSYMQGHHWIFTRRSARRRLVDRGPQRRVTPDQLVPLGRDVGARRVAARGDPAVGDHHGLRAMAGRLANGFRGNAVDVRIQRS